MGFDLGNKMDVEKVCLDKETKMHDMLKEQCAYAKCKKDVYVASEDWSPDTIDFFCDWECEMWGMGIGWFILSKTLLTAVYIVAGIVGIAAIFFLFNGLEALSVKALLVIITLLLLFRK